MMIVGALYTALAIWIWGCTLYLVVLTVAAFFFKPALRRPETWPSLAVLIPAHNEEGQIAQTIQSVLEADYAGNRNVIVIADNCTDATAAMAKASGAMVVERHDPDRRGKGQALDWFLRSHQDYYGDFAVLTLVDADTLIDKTALQELVIALEQDGRYDAAQAYYGVSNPQESWRTALSSVALSVFHRLRPAGRVTLGGSAGLKGNGMAFRRELLQNIGWPAFSIVEDLELSNLLLLKGRRTAFTPRAKVFGEMAAAKRQADTQRRRWEGGRFDLLRTQGPKLLHRFTQSREWACMDAFLDLATPPLSMLVLLQGVLALAAWVLFPGVLILAIWALAGSVIYVLAGLLLDKAPFRIWLALFAAPLFILWKMGLYVKLIKSGPNQWERTERKNELEPNARGEKWTPPN